MGLYALRGHHALMPSALWMSPMLVAEESGSEGLVIAAPNRETRYATPGYLLRAVAATPTHHRRPTGFPSSYPAPYASSLIFPPQPGYRSRVPTAPAARPTGNPAPRPGGDLRDVHTLR